MKQLISLGALMASLVASPNGYTLPDDMNQPLEIQADEASFNQNTGEAIYKGNVFVKQGTIEIQAEYLKVTSNTQTRQFSSLEAKGSPAVFSQQIDWSGNIVISKGNEIHYLTDESKLEITGDGYLSRMQNAITADYIQYNINSGAFTAEKKDSGRVMMTLQPQSAEQPQETKAEN